MASPWAWKQYGECGQWVSDLVPHLATCVDEMAFLPAMVSKSNVHGPATFMQNTGFVLPGFPSMGAWVSYGLGSMTDNLPTFVVLPDARGFAPNGPGNWSAGFLPAAHQGTLIRPAAEESDRRFVSAGRREVHHPGQRRRRLGPAQGAERTSTATGREEDSRLEARIASLRAGRQAAAQRPEVLDLSAETEDTRAPMVWKTR